MVLDVGQGGLVGDVCKAGGAVQVLADGGALDGAVAVHHSIDGLGFGKLLLPAANAGIAQPAARVRASAALAKRSDFFIT